MDRRNFLKTTSIALISSTIIPNILKADTISKWISFNDEKPKIDQRIISLSIIKGYIPIRGNFTDYSLIIGKNVDVSKLSLPGFKKIEIGINKEYRISQGYGKTIAWRYNNANDDLKDIRNLSWVKKLNIIEERKIDKEKSISLYPTIYENHYWMPINKLPKTLPPIP